MLYEVITLAKRGAPRQSRRLRDLLVFLGGYPVRYLLIIMGSGVLALALFILIAKAFPDAMPNRIDTWMSRLESFSNDVV